MSGAPTWYLALEPACLSGASTHTKCTTASLTASDRTCSSEHWKLLKTSAWNIHSKRTHVVTSYERLRPVGAIAMPMLILQDIGPAPNVGLFTIA